MSIKYAMLLILPLITSCQTKPNPLIIGHRGARGHVAENTLPSIEKAMALGVDGVEIDIFKCATGELVVFHDQTLDHLTNASGLIEMQTLDSLRKIDVLNGYQIPTLVEVLELLDGQIILNIELKGNNTARDTHLLLTKYFQRSNWTADKLIISSFNWDELRNFRALNPTIPLAVLTEDDPLDALPVAQELGAVAINPNYQSLDLEKVEKIKKAGFKIYPWTVNTPAAIAEMKQLGVDAIITDYPERVQQ